MRIALTLFIGIASAAGNNTVDYGRDVRPILSENCLPCHGQDSKKRMANLRLDTREGAIANRDDRAALVPGKLEASGIHQRITAEDPAKRMPPAYSNRTLTNDQISILSRWIEEGGQYSKHWAFIPPSRAPVPETTDRSWGEHPTDAFVLKRLEEEGLHPNPPAPPGTWLRRVSLDLTGLPPSTSELDSFAKAVRTDGDAAYSAAVDRLLASPAYGERMAMDWLDVARYADTHGFNNDAERSMWRWRDWVIESFNANQPYDRFLTEQLAGDLLPNPTLDQRIATGFGRNHVINSEGGIIEEEYRVEYVADRVRTLGMAWIGLTLECARCHDHKYDPITQRDHYRFFAFFNNIAEFGEDGRVANAVPMIPAPTREQQRELHRLESAIAVLEKRIGKTSAPRAAAPAKPPGHPALEIRCEPAGDEFEDPPNGAVISTAGVVGQACEPALATPKLQTACEVGISKRAPFTFAAWLRPAVEDADVPVLSSGNYRGPQSSSTYGKGIDLRLVNGELEFRLSDRFPAYSVRVRSEGAGIGPGQWRHVAVVYEGAAARPDTMRVHAAWVRMFIDGREAVTTVINDGAMMSPPKESPVPIRFRVGWDNSPDGARYGGLLDEISFWNDALQPDEIAALARAELPSRKRLRKIENLRAQWLALRRSIPTAMVMEELSPPRQTHVLLRGAYNAPGEIVEAGVPEELLGAWPDGAPKNRLGLAMWLTKPDHPLTARVVVNRFWQQLFGQGLVRTSDNFGLQGEWPSHPELLDWLAREFVESGWNTKALMKQIVLSATYRQDSSASPDLVARDPENRLLARGPRFRLPAELIRDQALAVSALLTDRVGGPSVFPYQKEDLYKGIVVGADYPGTKWVESKGADLYRRSLYTFWKRTVTHPFMTVFDAPDREFCIVHRSITNTPLQALTLLNDPIYVEAARKLAERSIREGGKRPAARLAYAFRLATGRAPDQQELRILEQKLSEMLAAYRDDKQAARSLLAVGASLADASISAGELAAYAAVANMILNLDEVITKG
jgi:hypothetical protein